MAKNKKAFRLETKNFSLPKLHLDLSDETKRGIAVVVFSALAIVTILSMAGIAGSFGNLVYTVATRSLGLIGYLLPLFFILIAITLFRYNSEEQNNHIYFRTYLGVFMLCTAIAGLIHIVFMYNCGDAFAIASAGQAGGYLGALVAVPFRTLFGFYASLVILLALIAISIFIMFDISLLKIWQLWQARQNKKSEDNKELADKVKINTMDSSGFVSEKVVGKNKKATAVELESKSVDGEVEQDKQKTTTTIPVKPAVNIASNQDVTQSIEAIAIEDRKDWKLPPFDILDDNKTKVDSGNIEEHVAVIQKTLSDFGIEVQMGEVNVGPTVTQYTLKPATGVKLSQIAALQNDLALALSAHSIRMELPIPGRGLVGIEVPNKATAVVRLREVMQTTDFIDFKNKLGLALGRDVAGRPIVADLAKMPHLLIAGATGTGKSVAINSLFISLLYRNTPQDVKFIVVDPKRVELSLYNGIPHLLTPAITEPDKAVNALKWAVAEMDRRYRLLAEAGKRNIAEYNEISPLSMSYIVIIVDELADLMAVAQQDVEAAIVRLAQMARAVGIHLVLATQRPSVEVITGLIKANITSRIAFAVASQIDSRTILDSSGAEKLLGNGDMLFVSAESNKPRRVQGAYINEKEVRRVVDFFKGQTGAVIYNEEILEKPKRSSAIPGLESSDEAEDDLYEEAKAEVMRAGKASASLLQRRLRVGYARAARLLDILEDKGVIGPGEGAKPREVYGVIPPSEKAEYGIEE